jgi:hypothetical protein
MSDSKEWIVEGFKEGVAALPDELTCHLLPDKAWEYGRRAARVAVAPLVWSQAVGERLDTGQAMEVLGVTRQALSKRVAAGSLVGIPGRGTTYFPAWQFDMEKCEVRPSVRHVIGTFAEVLGKPDPHMIAAWATTPQHEDLDGMTPSEWIVKGEDLGSLIQAARRAAGRLTR